MLLACHQCGGVLEVAALGAVTLVVSLATSFINYLRKPRKPTEPSCKICGRGGSDIDRNRRCIMHRFDENARRLW